MVDRRHPSLSIVRQCRLLDISRSGLYYQPKVLPGKDEEDLTLMKLIDRQYLATPFYGARKIAAWLKSQSHQVNRKRLRRLMQLMGLKAVYRRPRTSKPAPGHKIYPYLLGGLRITRPNQVWAADITYIPILPRKDGGFFILSFEEGSSTGTAGMCSPGPSWEGSNTLDAGFCVEALEEALKKGRPDIFNTDQGAQFTSEAFTGLLQQHGVRISMDGKGSYNDNLFIERLWQSVKYEELYLKAYQDGREARIGLGNYFRFYNTERPHQALGYRTPAEVFTSTPVEATSTGMVESLKPDPDPLRIAVPTLNTAPILS